MKRGLGSPNYTRGSAVSKLANQALRQQGRIHKWNPDSAKAAGSKGGKARAENIRARNAQIDKQAA